MFGCGRRAERGDGVANPRLVQPHDVDVALDDQQARKLRTALAYFVEPVEFLALVEEGGFGRIEILWLAVADHPSAESDCPAARVTDRKHQPVTEAVIVSLAVARLTTLALDRESEFGELAHVRGARTEAAQDIAP